MTIYGYCRISTPSQSIDRQVRNIKTQYPAAHIVEEVYTGTKQDRPEWNKLYKCLKEKDTIVFDSVSRMSRNAKEGFEMYQNLYDMNVNLVFIKEPHINTSTYKNALKSKIDMRGDKVDYILKGVNEYLLELAKDQIRLAFEQSQKEVDDLHQRTREGMETARRNGKQIGQRKGNTLKIKKEKPIKEIIKKKSRSYEGSLNDIELMAFLNCSTIKVDDNSGKKRGVSAKLSRNTFYKYKNEIRGEMIKQKKQT